MGVPPDHLHLSSTRHAMPPILCHVERNAPSSLIRDRDCRKSSLGIGLRRKSHNVWTVPQLLLRYLVVARTWLPIRRAAAASRRCDDPLHLPLAPRE